MKRLGFLFYPIRKGRKLKRKGASVWEKTGREGRGKRNGICMRHDETNHEPRLSKMDHVKKNKSQLPPTSSKSFTARRWD